MSDTSPVYLLARLQITDMDAFTTRYVAPLKPINEKYGVETLVGAPEVSVLEGEYDGNLTVVLRFPSAAAQEGWYADTDYQPLKDIRRQLTDTDRSTLLIAPAFTPPAG